MISYMGSGGCWLGHDTHRLWSMVTCLHETPAHPYQELLERDTYKYGEILFSLFFDFIWFNPGQR
jgi:hypothetical protein